MSVGFMCDHNHIYIRANCHQSEHFAFVFVISNIRIFVNPSMNYRRLFESFRQTSNLVFKRYSFSRADRIKLLNYEIKSLYGPVIKTTTSAKGRTTIKHEETPPSATTKKPEADHESEMYWIIGNKISEIIANPRIRIFSTPKIIRVPKVEKPSEVTSMKQTADDTLSNKENSSVSEPKKSVNVVENKVADSSVIQNPILLPKVKVEKTPKVTSLEQRTDESKLNILQTTAARRFPILSDSDLNNVLKHPLQSEVLAAPPTNIREFRLQYVPSVGRILQYSMSEAARNALLNWKLTKIRELGEQGFADLQQGEQLNN